MKRSAVIGHPISHSLSPIIFRALAKKEIVQDLSYETIDVEAAGLPAFVGQARSSMIGFNVTLPHKESIVALVDDVSKEVALTGAANVVHMSAGRAVAHNTDVEGIVRTWAERKISVEGASVLLLGAGGAARATCVALARLGANHVMIWNRTKDRAMSVVEYFGPQFPRTQFSCLENLEDHHRFSMVVQATPLGMQGVAMESNPILDQIQAHHLGNAVAFDLVYRPSFTPFLKKMAGIGANVVGGLDMLVYQALATWNIWFGPLSDAMEAKSMLVRELAGHLYPAGRGNVYLCGFMGAGKSSVGKRLASKLGRTFVDLDQKIQQIMGMSISDSFEKYGEECFRNVESEVLKEVTQDSHQIVSLGGGTLMRANHLPLIESSGVLVYLSARADTLAKRLEHSKNTRPLLKKRGPEQSLQNYVSALLKTREATYQKAKLKLATDGKSVPELTDMLAKFASEHEA